MQLDLMASTATVTLRVRGKFGNLREKIEGNACPLSIRAILGADGEGYSGRELSMQLTLGRSCTYGSPADHLWCKRLQLVAAGYDQGETKVAVTHGRICIVERWCPAARCPPGHPCS